MDTNIQLLKLCMFSSEFNTISNMCDDENTHEILLHVNQQVH